MKKIICLLTFFSGFFSSAQYIEPTRIEIEAHVGYGVTIGLGKLNADTNFIVGSGFNKSYSGLITEIAAYYRTGFDSRYLIGLQFNYSKGVNHSETVQISETDFDGISQQGTLMFIGPSFRKEMSNRIGTTFVTLSLSPGVMLLENKISGTSNGTVKSTGYALNLGSSMAYAIYKDLLFTTNIGFDYVYFPKATFDFSDNNSLGTANSTKAQLLRPKIALGLRYKL